MKLALNWPPRPVHSNSRRSWSVVRRAVKKYRADCAVLAQADGWHRLTLPEEGVIRLKVQFCPPDRRKRDLINMPSALKAGFDGLADALGVNDHRFRVTYADDWGPVVKHGQVIVELEL